MSGVGVYHTRTDAASNDASSITADKIVCPCCPLHCDDLTGAELSSSSEHCSLAFKRLQTSLVNGSRSFTPEEELERLKRCAEAVRTSARTIITGRVLDLATSRAIVKFSELVGAEIRVEGPYRTAQAVMKRDGSYTCTLGELTRPKTSLLVIGDVELAWPRVLRHLKDVQAVAHLDDSPELLDQLTTLRWSAESRSTPATQESPSPPMLRQALELVKQASYLVVLVAPLQEDSVRGPLIWSSILGLVQNLNRSRRAAILTFDESYTLRSTMASRQEKVTQSISTVEPTLQIQLSPFGESYNIQSPSILYIGRAAVDAPNHLLLPATTPGIDSSGLFIG